MYPFFSSIPIFGSFSSFGVTVQFLLLIVQINDHFLAGFTGWSSSGYASTLGTLIVSSSVIGFDRDALFIWALSWFTSLRFSWIPSLTGILGGTARGLDFPNISV